MKIILSPDSYKESLSAYKVVEIMSTACKAALSSVDSLEIYECPLADGGEGSVQSLVKSTNGRLISTKVSGPFFKKVLTYYGENDNRTVAFIEVANICGIEQIPLNHRNPFYTTSFGVGEIIRELLEQGYKKIVLGLGGSCTNDAGIGMLTALGAKFFDRSNQELSVFGEDILKVDRVDFSGLDPRLNEIELVVASDVDNILCGVYGASQVYGPQKGATPSQIKKLDESFDKLSQLIEKAIGRSYKMDPGAGAAGGLGFACMLIGGKIRQGAQLIAEEIGLETFIQNADLVITGEGKSDKQTLYGKVPGYVSELSRKYQKPVVLISGSLVDIELLEPNFTGVFSIVNKPMLLHEAIEQAEDLLYIQTKVILKLLINGPST